MCARTTVGKALHLIEIQQNRTVDCEKCARVNVMDACVHCTHTHTLKYDYDPYAVKVMFGNLKAHFMSCSFVS